ncbi:MAG: hypothetical protein EXX96DRAFT_535879 [Benjaminiella poitrasii]|nr:MAG: hypothetical protein EXX96DRAFT_535879 [Benjaminiella poitrasii]
MEKDNATVGPPTPQITLLPIAEEITSPPSSSTLNEKQIQFTAIPPVLIEQDQSPAYFNRAGIATKPRLLLMTSIGSFWGFSIGAFLGARQSGLQYLAENAHKLPTTVQGWYFYHKTKNYRMMLGGIKRGVRYAGKTGGLCLLYGTLEATMDDIRGEADVLNSVTAGVTTGTLFSLLTRLTRGSFRYSIAFGAVFGLAAGGLSDLYRYAAGDTPSWLSTTSSPSSKDK